MASKTTPENKNKRKPIDSRSTHMEEETPAPRLGKRNTSKHRDSSTIAVVNPRMVQRLSTLSTPTNVVQTYRSSSTACRSYQSPISRVFRPPSTVNQYLEPRPVYPARYAHPPPMPVPPMHRYATPPPVIGGYYPDTRWCTMVTTYAAPNPIYAIPIPTVAAMPVPIFSPVPQVCPYAAYLGPPLITEAGGSRGFVLSPIPTTVSSSNHMFGQNFVTASQEYQPPIDLVSPMIADNAGNSGGNNLTGNVTERPQNSPLVQTRPLDPEHYLMLPRNLFPPARSLREDPNPIIDQFCRVRDYEQHSLWILDLEFGVPREPVTRPIASYNVKCHSVHCLNIPGAIHPGFESCNYDFKNIFLFYYDRVVSAWYRGFVTMNADRSVDNFQSWLDVPMQIYGMCWP